MNLTFAHLIELLLIVGILIAIGIPLFGKMPNTRLFSKIDPLEEEFKHLLVRKEEILLSIKELEVDLQADKISIQDSDALRNKLEGEAIAILERIEELEKNKIETKSRISFYASTRSYADVMREHGWNDTHEKLYRMSIDGEWNKMGAEITDEMLGNFAVVGTHDQIADEIKSTYGRYASSVSFSIPVNTDEDEDVLRNIIKDLSES